MDGWRHPLAVRRGLGGRVHSAYDRSTSVNIWDIVIVIVIAAALFLAIRAVGKRKKTGGCGCGCAGCSSPCALKQTEEPQDKQD
ncbi:MAG: FeoB-associated Cys-rich membrane protein [Firmicutes bacterium]|nr:FeoB-associated Cys-rich membrane protein [Bacillota bacterium]